MHVHVHVYVHCTCRYCLFAALVLNNVFILIDAVFPNNKSTCTLQQELKHTACAVEATDYQNQQDTMNQVMDQEEQMNQETGNKLR